MKIYIKWHRQNILRGLNIQELEVCYFCVEVGAKVYRAIVHITAACYWTEVNIIFINFSAHWSGALDIINSVVKNVWPKKHWVSLITDEHVNSLSVVAWTNLDRSHKLISVQGWKWLQYLSKRQGQ